MEIVTSMLSTPDIEMAKIMIIRNISAVLSAIPALLL
ncbi:hypothetical protein SDC9_190318 [bioreactor metagenome]|uniref:Uncharacterized protein n=1 Tax=bioreactor metagenome TaxID=1076179 RepID=A0A645HUN1_9ZZZZ